MSFSYFFSNHHFIGAVPALSSSSAWWRMRLLWLPARSQHGDGGGVDGPLP